MEVKIPSFVLFKIARGSRTTVAYWDPLKKVIPNTGPVAAILYENVNTNFFHMFKRLINPNRELFPCAENKMSKLGMFLGFWTCLTP